MDPQYQMHINNLMMQNRLPGAGAAGLANHMGGPGGVPGALAPDALPAGLGGLGPAGMMPIPGIPGLAGIGLMRQNPSVDQGPPDNEPLRNLLKQLSQSTAPNKVRLLFVGWFIAVNHSLKWSCAFGQSF